MIMYLSYFFFKLNIYILSYVTYRDIQSKKIDSGMLPTDIENHLMETLAINKIMRDFKLTTNIRLATVRDLNWESQRIDPKPVPVNSVIHLPDAFQGGRIYESEARAICNDFRSYYQQQGYHVGSVFDTKTRMCTLQFTDAFNEKFPRPPESVIKPFSVINNWKLDLFFNLFIYHINHNT